MKKLTQISLMLWLFVSHATAQESQPPHWYKIFRVCDWKELNLPQPGCEIISTGGVSILKIENTNDAPMEVSVLTITNASIIKKASILLWDMKYAFPSIQHGGGGFIPAPRGYPSNVYPTVLPPHLGYAVEEFSRCYPPSAPGGDEITNEDSFDIRDKSNWEPYSFSWSDSPTRLDLKFLLM